MDPKSSVRASVLDDPFAHPTGREVIIEYPERPVIKFEPNFVSMYYPEDKGGGVWWGYYRHFLIFNGYLIPIARRIAQQTSGTINHNLVRSTNYYATAKMGLTLFDHNIGTYNSDVYNFLINNGFTVFTPKFDQGLSPTTAFGYLFNSIDYAPLYYEVLGTNTGGGSNIFTYRRVDLNKVLYSLKEPSALIQNAYFAQPVSASVDYSWFVGKFPEVPAGYMAFWDGWSWYIPNGFKIDENASRRIKDGAGNRFAWLDIVYAGVGKAFTMARYLLPAINVVAYDKDSIDLNRFVRDLDDQSEWDKFAKAKFNYYARKTSAGWDTYSVIVNPQDFENRGRQGEKVRDVQGMAMAVGSLVGAATSLSYAMIPRGNPQPPSSMYI